MKAYCKKEGPALQCECNRLRFSASDFLIFVQHLHLGRI
jgi:hypothetical protein